MQDRVDVLNRDGFVNKIFNIINVITENKKIVVLLLTENGEAERLSY